jgi:acyl dehydratase
MTVRELDSAPALGPLYGKAVLGSVLPGGGDELPGETLVRRGVTVDRENLAEYCRVCGFTLSDRLPPTYPHLLAFPLSMSLMTARRFPFSLLGLVHIANAIAVRRPVDAGEVLDFEVRIADLRPHGKGKQFDVVAEASTGDDVAWASRSTYLRRGEGGDEQAGREDSLPEFPGRPSAIWEVPGDIGRRYAEVSGDRNPIHMHSLSARLFGFDGAIAHGMWTKARSLAQLEGALPEAFSAEVEFAAPLRIPGKARFVTDADGDGRLFRLERLDGERSHLTGRISPL